MTRAHLILAATVAFALGVATGGTLATRNMPALDSMVVRYGLRNADEIMRTRRAVTACEVELIECEGRLYR